MANPTPGPWEANLHHTCEQAGRTYAMVAPAGSVVPVAGVVLGVEGCSQEQGRANARLIAAAPEMADALNFILSLAEEEYEHSKVGTGAEVALRHIIRKARAAIAKATPLPMVSATKE